MSLRWRLVILLCGLCAAAIGLASGCLESNHCGYAMGDATCAQRDASRPYCDLCVQANRGCVAAPPTDLECALPSGESASPGSTGGESSGEGSSSSSDASTTTSASTTAGVSSSDATATTGPTTTTTTTTTATTGDTTTGEPTTTTGDSDGTTTTTSTSTTGEPTTTSTTTDDPSTSTSTTTSTTTGSTTMSEPICGNGELEGMELCDGDDLDGKVCADFPTYGGGALECAMNCTFDLGGCCLANGQPCMNDGQCCPGKACKFDVQALKNICK